MRIPAAAAFAVLTSPALYADFGYEMRTEIAGGIRAKIPAVTRLIKDQRLASYSKDHDTILNLQNETIYEVDFHKKTYSSLTFAQMKVTLDRELKNAPAFQIAAQSGGTKSLGILTAREQLVRMTGPPSLARVFLDYWTSTPPGFREMQEFHQQLAAKLGYAYAFGWEEAARIDEKLYAGFEQAAKILIQSDEMPVQVTLRMGDSTAGDLAPPAESSPTGIVGGAVSRIENLAHRKPSGAAGDQPGLLAEVSVELSAFSAGPADESKFNVPGGFKEIKPPEGNRKESQ